MNQRIRWTEALMLCGLLAALLVGVVVIPRWLYPPLKLSDLRGIASPQARIQLQQAQSQLANDARTSVLQGLAGLLLVVGAIATWRQVNISHEGQITDRFTRAVDQLGSPVIDVRIGALYALERIARNSPADRDHIQYLLGTFIRTRMPWPGEVVISESQVPSQPTVGSWLGLLARFERRVGPKETARRPARGQRHLPEGAANRPHPTPTVDENLPWMRVRAPDIQAAMGVLGRAPRRGTSRPSTCPGSTCEASRFAAPG